MKKDTSISPYIFIVSFFVSLLFSTSSFIFAGNLPQTTSPSAVHAIKGVKISTADTIIFDLANAKVTPTYIDIPVKFSAKELVYAIDFSFLFNQNKLTYDSLITYTKNAQFTPLAHFNGGGLQELIFTSSTINQSMTADTVLVGLRFLLKSTNCLKISSADFYSVSTLLNGTPCSFKFTPLAPQPGQPKANFILPTPACVNSTLNFSDASVLVAGNMTSRIWNFGNGQGGNDSLATVQYAAIGKYKISLTVVSSAGCRDSITKAIAISSVPVVAFTPTVNCATKGISIVNNSHNPTGSIKSYAWTFGDSTSLTGSVSPSHIYKKGGKYPIVLTVKSDSGCVATMADTVLISSPIVQFSSMNGCVAQSLQFKDSSYAVGSTIQSLNWKFGDGGTGTLGSILHAYSAAGNYPVTLIATTSTGCKDSLTKMIGVQSYPTVRFTAPVVTGCRPMTVDFKDSSVYSPGAAFQWSFGDGTRSAQQNPVHVYNANGVFSVTHVVTTSFGCKDSATTANFIKVNNTGSALFHANNVCLGSLANFTDSSQVGAGGSITAWNWDFGDGNNSKSKNPGYLYASAGTYIVKLKITIDNNCIDSTQKTIQVGIVPSANFGSSGLSGCFPYNTAFRDSSQAPKGSTFLWIFGDGDTSKTQNPKHTYLKDGLFTVQHYVTTPLGCADSMFRTGYIKVLQSPIAGLSVSADTVYLPKAEVQFNGSTSSGYSTLLWSFGDSTYSSKESPSHVYVNLGKYKACINLGNVVGCSASACDTIHVEYSSSIAVLPSAFTPNGDGKNDVLRVRGGPFKSMELHIFDEWGLEMFYSNNQANGWDGTANGQDQPIGSYIYTLDCKTFKGEKLSSKGLVNLVR